MIEIKKTKKATISNRQKEKKKFNKTQNDKKTMLIVIFSFG